MKASPRRRLFWRIYLHNILLLVSIALVFILVDYWLIRPRLEPIWTKQASHLASGLAKDFSRSSMQEAAVTLHESYGLHVSIYDAQQDLLGTSVTPPTPAAESHISQLLQGEVTRESPAPRIAAPLQVDGEYVGYAVFSIPEESVFWQSALLVLSLVLVLFAIVSIPLTRSVSKPLEQLAAAARELGQGDLTARTTLRRKDELGELGDTFNEMAERLSSQILAEKELLANVSHELRTPMARIRVALDLASEEEAADASQYFAGIADDLRELERLVDDVLTATRLDLATRRAGDSLPLRKSPTDLRELLASVVARFREAHPERRLETSLGDVPALSLDPTLMRRAIENLVDNALKYAEPPCPILLSASIEKEELRISISDRGIGIDPKEQPRLFQPFFRTDRSRTRDTGGLGMGLVLVKRIIEAHRGQVLVESAPGQGTTFTLSLPIEAAPP